jgi:mRNA-degrading endonuclease YafQ of YafQ-DinJ toxin-antitoxin module
LGFDASAATATQSCPDHLADDWLLVYRISGDDIQFARTGTHTDIFET